ncbi:hypothetical protein ACFLZ0_00555 [Patescibacteria group bacterium]
MEKIRSHIFKICDLKEKLEKEFSKGLEIEIEIKRKELAKNSKCSFPVVCKYLAEWRESKSQ